jgi:hypothetical protein
LQQPVIEDQLALAHDLMAMGWNCAVGRDFEDIEAKGVVLVQDMGGAEPGALDLEAGPRHLHCGVVTMGGVEGYSDLADARSSAGGEEIAPDHLGQGRRRDRAISGIDQKCHCCPQAGGFPGSGTAPSFTAAMRRQLDREVQPLGGVVAAAFRPFEPAVGEAEFEPGIWRARVERGLGEHCHDVA